MGLVQNLKKKLSVLGDKILVELSCLYIKQLAKQTLKKQDNYSSTESSPNPLTTEPQDTIIATSSADISEKTIMENSIEPIIQVREWSIDRIHHLADTGDLEQQFDAVSIAEEFDEWINIPEDQKEVEYLSLEELDDQEADIS